MKLKLALSISILFMLKGCSTMSERDCNEEFGLTPEYRLYHWTNDYSLPFPDTSKGEAFKKCLKVFQPEYDKINCDGHIRSMELTIDAQSRNPNVFPVDEKLYKKAMDVCATQRMDGFNNNNREYLIKNDLL